MKTGLHFVLAYFQNKVQKADLWCLPDIPLDQEPGEVTRYHNGFIG